MKGFSTVIAVIAITLFLSIGVFAQGRGQAGRPSGIGAPSNPGTSSANHPTGKPEGAGNAADHTPGSAGPKDANGFKNYGQYVAAKHVSENLGIPFADLKTAMVDGHKSLGDAIHTLRPDLNKQQVQEETKKAEAAAKKSSAEAKKH